MEDRYKIKWTKFIVPVSSFFIYSIGFLINLYFYLKENNVLIFSAIVLLIFSFLITELILFTTFFIENKGVTLYINRGCKSIKYEKKKLLITVSFDQINKITLNKTFYRAKNGAFILPFDYYHYAEIELNDKRKIIVTNLLCEDLNLNLENRTQTLIRKFTFIK